LQLQCQAAGKIFAAVGTVTDLPIIIGPPELLTVKPAVYRLKPRIRPNICKNPLRGLTSSSIPPLLTGGYCQGVIVLLLQKTKRMKKTLVAAALLLIIGTTRASETRKHSDEHNILSTELPVALQSSIKTAYSGYWITELTEEGKDKHVKYTLTLENADQILHLRADKAGEWEVVDTTAKGE
jgi:hypothetical protein